MGCRVLVVDDSDVLRKIVSFNLTKEGYVVEEARDGVEGLEKMKSNKPDLVILDVMMPHLNGFEVLKRMRADPELLNIPVIILTAKGGENDAKMALQSGANGFLTKPFSPVKLIEEVRRVTQRGG
ncbi:MAG: response regulator [Pseudothermotoga sp.]|uniref:response regulator transcription factor n=1 Tax=Pseudothermotoga sp. TaxID=2033661 RepID=UPI000E9866DB|nr:response regulator [Pseudothermotoga sp.]HBT38638.1 two-component system response regulator [Pseudothermotoga sp.]HCO98151.1 two-component system response regulator [Pseudothermotoga sp.]